MAKNETVYNVTIKGTTELQRLRKTIDETERSLKNLKKQKNQNKETTDRQVKGLDHLERKLKSTRQEYNKMQKSITATNKTTKSGSGFVTKMTGAFAAANIATAAFTKVTQILGTALKNAFKTATEFEFAMAKVKAISGATEKEFKTLIATAKGLGATTFFTASQVAELQLNLSKLGFSSDEILDSQEAILKLSQALGEDLGRTATVVAASIRGFGEDTDQTTRFANAMAAAFANSALDIEKFQTSMTKVSAIAATAGFSFEETTALLGTLTDRGIEASIAGTSLRNILLKLQDPSSDLAQKLGRTVHSGDDLVRALKELDDSGIDVAGVMEIVDNRQVQAMESFIRSADAVDHFTTVLENSKTAAEDMSKIMEKTVKGSILTMKSAYEGAILAMTTSTGRFSKFFRGVFDFITESLQTFALVVGDEQETAIMKSAEARSRAMAEMAKDDKLILSDALKTQVDLMKENVKQIEKERKLNIKLGQQATAATLQLERDAKNNAIKLLEEQIAEEIKLEKAASEKKEQKEIKLKNEEAIKNAKLSEQLKKLKAEQQDLIDVGDNLTEVGIKKLKLKNQEIKAIEEQIKSLKTLGVEEEKKKQKPKVIEDSTVLQDAELAIFNERQNILEQFADGEIQTKAELNQQLKEMEIEHLQWVIDNNLAAGDELIAIEQRLLQAKVDSKQETQKQEVDRIDQMKETGKILMKIGEAEGENSKARLVGIKISQAAAVASGIQGLIEAKAALANQAAGGDPFTAFARVAAMAGMMASVVVSLKGLMSGSDKFEQGGLTNGGMFKGASHANGGVKFAVGGRIHEAEGGEAIINKRSTAMFKPMLSAINQAGGGVKFANGGFLSTGEKFAMGGEVTDVQQMISGMGGSTQVVMVESDVTRTQDRVSNIESQATF